MRIFDFGSLNIDRVYELAHFVQPGETAKAASMKVFAGGKGLNQSVAAARAGAQVVHAGAVGPDGDFLLELLGEAGADLSCMKQVQEPSGHAVIQVDESGQNAIIVCSGANGCLTEEYIDQVLDTAQQEDWILLQNEVSNVAYIIQSAARRGLRVVWNPSPMPENLQKHPLDQVYLFMVNELEAAQLAGKSEGADPEKLLDELCALYPKANVVMTLGSKGVMCRVAGESCFHKAYRVKAVDTTGAGDTFCGYFLAGLCQQRPLAECLARASAASAIAVSRPGAAPAIPVAAEVEAFLSQNG